MSNSSGHQVHGQAGKFRTPIYQVWRAMMQRCYRTNDKNYKDYGARGIVVCSAWHSFPQFFSDMGTPPRGMSLDRRDNNGNYCKENCRWVPHVVQVRNRRNTKTLTHNGETRPVAEWAELKQIPFNCLRRRIDIGWNAERALSTPVLSRAEISKLGTVARYGLPN